jgi:hypothetical protein
MSFSDIFPTQADIDALVELQAGPAPVGPNTFSRLITAPPVDTGLTASDERLHIIRSRAAKTLYDNNGRDTYTTDRGPITTMKLLPGPDYVPANAVRGAASNVDEDVKALVAGRFVNFFLTNIQTSFNEKVQVTQTFGDNEVVYYFGRQPILMNISGLLFDSLENDWFSKFLTLYAGVLRGTQLAKSFSLVEITFPNMVVRGTISSLSINQDAQRDTDIPFGMQFLAKEVIPLPVPIVHGTAKNLKGELIDWRADRQGVQGYSLSSGGLGGGFMDSTTKTVGTINQGSLGDTVSEVSTNLTSFRTNIFTPVYGVISSITKIVKSATGDITTIISSFSNPVNQVLRDISSVATQAAGVAILVESSVNGLITIPNRTAPDVKTTLRILRNSAGTISRVPENISETFKRLYGSGRIKRGAAILSGGKARQKSKAAVLTSGAPYIPNKSNKL